VTKPLSVVLVDDEHLARRGLSMRLGDIGGIEILAECANGDQALAAVAEHEPDVLFLDIQMPGMTGFDVVGNLQADNLPAVIFVTAHDEFAVEAFRVHAVDYLLKPVEPGRLREALQRARAHTSNAEQAREKEKLVEVIMSLSGGRSKAVSAEDAESGWPEKLTIKDGDEITLVPVGDIQWVDAAGDYMCLHTAAATHIMRITMKQLEAMLNPSVFVRVHRSTLVNVSEIAGAQTTPSSEYLLQLSGGAQVKVSRGYKDRIKAFLGA
jgi:two-component system LytT family response regulator